MKDKSKEYIIGFLTALLLCLGFYTMVGTKLQANSYFELGTMNNPMYVKVVK